MRRRLFLMRHGQVAYFDREGNPTMRPDLVSLTPKGREQTLAAKRALAGIRLGADLLEGRPNASVERFVVCVRWLMLLKGAVWGFSAAVEGCVGGRGRTQEV